MEDLPSGLGDRCRYPAKNMLQRLSLSMVLVLAVLGCKKQRTEPIATVPESEVDRAPVDFNSLLDRVNALNENDLDYFDANWPDLRAELRQIGADTRFSEFTLEQQGLLWERIAYLYECRHPTIFRKHGDDLEKILRLFDLPENNALLDAKHEFLDNLNEN